MTELLTPPRTGTTSIRRLADCPDGPGIVAQLTAALASDEANIRESSQFTTDPRGGRFFLRLVVDVAVENSARVETTVARVARQHDMTWRLWVADRPKRMAIMCSTGDHCVLDLLWRAQHQDLAVEIPLVVSNHDVLRTAVENFGVPFVHVPANPQNRRTAEAQILQEIRDAKVDFVVMARYMQILNDDFLENVGVPVINIHHSLLPAFIGAQPYRRAYERGVKIIGATAHYATAELDAGPIIAQDVEHVGHIDDAAAMQRRGKNIERTVLARAVGLHIEDRVHVYQNRTIIHV